MSPQFVKSKRLRSKKHMAHVRSFGCCICQNPVCDAHHLRSMGHLASAALKNGDDYTVPLCRMHHDELHAFGDEALFFALHGVDVGLILDTVRETSDVVQGKSKGED